MTAGVVWTYWLAFPLLGAALVACLTMAWLYYRRVLVPKYEWLDYQLAQSRVGTADGGGTIHRLNAGQTQGATRRVA